MTSWTNWSRASSKLGPPKPLAKAGLLVIAALAALAVAAGTPSRAQSSFPSARLLSAPRLTLPAEIDSSNPAAWSLVDGVRRLFVVSSWGGIPVRLSGASLGTLASDGPVGFSSHPGHGVWMEAIIPGEDGAWYGFYHHERAADLCGRPERQLPRIGAMRSDDHGQTWADLGIVLDAPAGTEACDSTNRFVLGGVGDVTVALDASGRDLYLYYSQYVRDGARQGVTAARIAWADRDAPAGKAAVWNDGGWLPATESGGGWSYPLGTPLVRSQRPFHDRSSDTDVFWGPSIHWNTYLEQYVMLLNRARDDQFGQEGVYVSYSPTLADPSRWTAPAKIFNGGGWYPQVIGEEPGVGTDRVAGKRARFFITGKSDRYIEFER